MKRGCTVVTAVWDTHARLLPELERRIEPFLDALERRGEVAELLVVDNDSRQPVELAGQRGRITRLGRRASIGTARNAGLLGLTTDTICFVDVDDRPDADALLEMHDELRRSPEHKVAVCGQLQRVYSDGGRYLGQWPHAWARALLRLPRSFALLNAFINEFPVAAGAILRSRAVLAAGGFADLDYGEDWVLAARLATQGQISFHRTATPIVYRPGGLSRLRGGDQVFDAYEGVRRTLTASPQLPRYGRVALRLVGRTVNRVRARFEESESARVERSVT